MKEVLRSPSPVQSFDVPPSLTPSQGHRQSIDNFLSRLGPGVLDTSSELDKSRQPRRSNGRRSHEMSVSKGTAEAKQLRKSSIVNVSSKSNNRNNVYHRSGNGNSMTNSLNKLPMQGNINTTVNSISKKLQTQSNKAQVTPGGSINNGLRSSPNSNMRPAMGQKGAMITQEERSSRHARAVVVASAAAAEAAAMAAQAAAEVMRLTAYASTTQHEYSSPYLDDFAIEEFLLASQAQRAATLIQSAYRGHLARQALRALKGLVKLQAVVRGHLVRRQARISLQCMQALVRLQARVRARQVKAAMLLAAAGLEQKGQEQGLLLPPPLLQRHSTQLNSQLQETPSCHRRLSPFHADILSSSPSHISPLLHPLDQSMQSQLRTRVPDSFSRTSSLLGRTPKSLGTPTRRMSNEYFQPQLQRGIKSSFNETEPEKLHRDWSWLEGWMAAHGTASVWESNAAALWESRDECRDRVGEGEENPIFYDSLYEQHRLEALTYEEYNDISHSLLHAHINSDDDPAIKIIEMDRAAPLAPSSVLSSPHSSSRNLHHPNNMGPHHYDGI